MKISLTKDTLTGIWDYVNSRWNKRTNVMT